MVKTYILLFWIIKIKNLLSQDEKNIQTQYPILSLLEAVKKWASMVSYFNIDLTIFSFISADLTLISFNETKILDPFLDLQSLLQLFCTGTFQ